MAKDLSGAHWVHRFPTSRAVGDLIEPFRSNVRQFLAALASANVRVSIAATYRPKERAYLMHYSAAVARRRVKPEDVPPMAGVAIEWTHPTVTASINAAAAMARAYEIVFPPALMSHHTRRRALDMRIDDALGKSVARADGTMADIRRHSPRDSDLFAVGALRTYPGRLESLLTRLASAGGVARRCVARHAASSRLACACHASP